MPTDDVNSEMRRHAQAAADMVQAEYGKKMDLKMDFTEATLGAVEAILNGFWQEGGCPDDFLATVALLFGSYIGEVIRNCFPQATWIPGSTTPDAAPPTLRVGDIDVFPMVWCSKRLYNGPQDSVVDKYLAFRQAIDSREATVKPGAARGRDPK
jgi:hypothetical protein